ncbi:hypothetical protein [Streptomyces sp. NPDC059010]|uniref:hypothetical protein n=1 Tax=Streptomyces sp. NPDC059010 TaxID=3346695 RepID=UPI0036C9C0BB
MCPPSATTASAARFADCPLLHPWRVLPQPPQPLPDELADVERAVAYGGGGPQVRERIEGLRTASSCLALFLEYIPHTLHDWLGIRLATGDAEPACTLVEQGLEATTAFLHAHQLLHFDTHFHNVLTDGRQLYLADYGLALSSRFPLTRQEHDFFARPGGGIPEAAAGVITRRARGAVVMDEFRHRLEHESRLAPYPHEALRDALQDVGMPASR